MRLTGEEIAESGYDKDIGWTSPKGKDLEIPWKR